MWSSPIAVLVAQAVAVAAGVVPLMRAAGAGWMAWVVAVSYGLAPGFAALIGFDFHEVALAVPLLAFSMAAMLRGDHRAAVLWALPLVLVKEDLGLTVAALGAVVFLRGSRGWGCVAMVVGAVSVPGARCCGCCRRPRAPAASPTLYAPHGAGGGAADPRSPARDAQVADRAVPAGPDGLAGAALADAAARRAAHLRLAVPLRPLHLLGPLVPVRRRPRARSRSPR